MDVNDHLVSFFKLKSEKAGYEFCHSVWEKKEKEINVS